MRSISVVSKAILLMLLIAMTSGFSSCEKVSRMNGREVVAMVDADPITVEEFQKELSSLHGSVDPEKKGGKIDYVAILNRLINARLIIREARTMGLDRIPEVEKTAEVNAGQILIDLLLKEHVKDIEPDPEETEEIYKERVKEWKIRTVLFQKKETAQEVEAKLKAGQDFAQVTAALIESGDAKGNQEGSYIPNSDVLPDIVEILSKSDVGSVSPVLPAGGEFMIFKLEDIRYAEDPKAMEQARKEARQRKISRTVTEYIADLKETHAKVDQSVFDSLDFGSAAFDLNKLRKDSRVLAEIVGDAPITVGEFVSALDEKLYHGIERTVENPEFRLKMEERIEQMLDKRVLMKEAARKGIDQTPGYKAKVEESERWILFGSFVNKVVIPDIRLQESDLKEYYDKHIAEYASPEMIRIMGIPFTGRDHAERALEKLRKGTDFNWIRANADGRVTEETEGLITFDGRLLLNTSLPADVRKTVAGSQSGEFRLHEGSGGVFYVLSISQVLPAKAESFEQKSAEIREKVASEKIAESIADWAAKLRKVYPVKIYKKALN